MVPINFIKFVEYFEVDAFLKRLYHYDSIRLSLL